MKLIVDTSPLYGDSIRDTSAKLIDDATRFLEDAIIDECFARSEDGTIKSSHTLEVHQSFNKQCEEHCLGTIDVVSMMDYLAKDSSQMEFANALFCKFMLEIPIYEISTISRMTKMLIEWKYRNINYISYLKLLEAIEHAPNLASSELLYLPILGVPGCYHQSKDLQLVQFPGYGDFRKWSVRVI